MGIGVGDCCLSGCGGGAGKGGDAATNRAGLTDFVTKLHAAQCAWIERCAKTTAISGSAKDTCELVPKLPANLRPLFLLDDTDIAHVDYDRTKGAACLDALTTAACSDTVQREACRDVFIGTLADGA